MKKLSFLALGCTLLSCAGVQKEPRRAPSSEEQADQASFMEEFNHAWSGVDPQALTHDKYKAGVFFKWMHADPTSAFHELQKYRPVASLGRMTGLQRAEKTWSSPVVLSNPADVRAALGDPKQFSNTIETRPGELSPFVLGGEAKGPASDLVNRLSAIRFGTEPGRSYQVSVRKALDSMLDAQLFVGKNREGRIYGRLELVHQIGRRLPAWMNQHYFGIPTPRQEADSKLKETVQISRALEDDLLFNPDQDTTIKASAIKAGDSIRRFFAAYSVTGTEPGTFLEQARRHSLHRKIDYAKVSQKQALQMQKVLAGIVGGIEITQTAAAHAIDQLLLHHKQIEARAAALSGDDNLLRHYFYEALRFNPVRPYALRQTTAKLTLPDGSVLEKGEPVILGTQSAMLDERTFPDPLSFKADRPLESYLHFARSGTPQVRDGASEIEAFEIFRALVLKPGLRRAAGQAGVLDHRTVFSSTLLKDTFRYSFPESFTLEFDANALRDRMEIANKDYMYEDYLRNFDRESYRNCLSDLGRFVTSENEDGDGKLAEVRKGPLGVIGAVLGSFKTSKLNRSRENKHLLYCRMPAKFRACMQGSDVNILQAKAIDAHEQAYAKCSSPLTETEKAFYEQVFFDHPLDTGRLSLAQAKLPDDPAYAFEDELKFYDRYRARESMMNPGGFSLPTPEMLFYVRLNIDFRMCLGAPVLKHKFTHGLLGAPKEEVYPKCKDGVWDPQAQKRFGALTPLEQYYYEKIMLGQDVSYEEVVRREAARHSGND